MEDIKLINDDCFQAIKNIDKESVDLILTDPPYLISRKTNFSKGGGCEKKYGSISMDFGEWDNKDFDIKKLLFHYGRILKEGGTMIVFFDIFKMQSIYDASISLKLNQPRIGVWDKSNAVPINAKINYLSNCREYFISFTKGKKRTFNSYYDKAFYSYPIVGGKERTSHPTQKPVKLMQDIIKTNTNENDVVFDSFMGSGSTGVACVNTGRKFIGIELDEKYFNIAKKRIDDAIREKKQSLFNL